MIIEADVQRVRDEADGVAIIGGYVTLRRRGNSHRGPCPFHKGQSDNFSVRGNYYRCWVCGEQGDLFTFLQKHLGLDFVGAVRLAAETTGITLRESDSRSTADPRAPLWEVNEAAREFFARELTQTPSAQAYLTDRGLSIEEMQRFELGWAPRSDLMRAHLTKLGFDDQRMLDAGLIGEEDGRRWARFRGRVTFSIRDIGAHLVGFAGRIVDAGEPKYLNTPETMAFRKSGLLYGLHQAKPAIRKSGRILIVEGYMDAIQLMRAGISEVVAPMGTAMTPEQAKLIRRFSSTAYLLYDRDAAGVKAAFRAGDALLAEGVNVRVVTLPEGHDPDSYARIYGASAIEEEIGMGSVDVFERKIELLSVAGYFDDVKRKREAFDKLAPTIAAAADPLTRGLYVAKAAEALSVSEDAVREAVAAVMRQRR